jgi:hypothetical protein
LPAARANARLSGYRGAKYPWESSPRFGVEAAPGGGLAAAHEHHVSLDVAFAVAQYAHATGDEIFLKDIAWPVLSAVAEFIASRATKTKRGYEIHRVTGVAEKKQPVDNNAFMNMAAVVVLKETIATGRKLGISTPELWGIIADELLIPVNRRTKVIKNHDKYSPEEEKGETPEALAGLFPFGYQVAPEVERSTLDFYLRLAPRYVGAPMLSALLGVWAARTGDRRLSAKWFEEGYVKFALEPFAMIDEYSSEVYPEMPRAGPFFANMGAFLTGCLYGLSGIRLGPGDPESWCERPVVMPAGWDGIEVERIWVRGKPARLSARHGDERARIEITGQPA